MARLCSVLRRPHLFDVDIKDGPVLKASESVEKGMGIMMPFDTPVGKVGMAICFDVSFSCHRGPKSSSYMTPIHVATISGDRPRSSTTRSSDHHLSIGLYGPDGKSALGGLASSSSDRNTIICYRGGASRKT